MFTRLNPLAVKVAKLVLASLIVVSIGKVLSSYVGELDFSNVNLNWLGLAFMVTLAYRLANAYGWTFVLRALSVNMGTWTTIRIWITSEACRWLPGSVWSYGSRALQTKKNGVPAVTAGASLLLEMLLTIGAWCITAVVGLVFFRDSFLALLDKVSWDSVPVSALGFFAVVLTVMALVVYLAGAKIKMKLASKLDPIKSRLAALRHARPSFARCVIALGYYVAMCFANGAAAAIVFRAVLPDSNVPLLAIVGANAAAWLVGFFAIMAPGGLVVREGAMATLLVAWLPAEQAIAAAVIWRFVQIVVEVTCMVCVYAKVALANWNKSRRLPAIG